MDALHGLECVVCGEWNPVEHNLLGCSMVAYSGGGSCGRVFVVEAVVDLSDLVVEEEFFAEVLGGLDICGLAVGLANSLTMAKNSLLCMR